MYKASAHASLSLGRQLHCFSFSKRESQKCCLGLSNSLVSYTSNIPQIDVGIDRGPYSRYLETHGTWELLVSALITLLIVSVTGPIFRAFR